MTITVGRDDFSVGLHAQLRTNKFCGIGGAWFDPSDVADFCEKMESLAVKMTGSASLVGCQSKADGSEYLETLVLRCYVLAASKLNGVVGIHVSLKHYPYTDCRAEEISTVSTELSIRNHKLAQFSNDLRNALRGSVDEVEVKNDLNDI